MKSLNLRQRGFTIVELLIVVVVIGILAAITTIAFTGLQRRANESASATAVETANKKLEVYKITNNNLYPGALNAADVQDYANTTYQYSVDGSYATYCVTATTNKASMYGSSTTPQPAKGGCAGHSVDGVPVITNYVYNPSLETNSLANWSYGSQTGYAFAASTTQKKFGSYAAAINVTTTSALDAFLVVNATVPTAGTYYASAWVYITSANSSYTNATTTCLSNGLDARWYNGATPTSVCYNRSTLNTWQRINTSFNVTAANTVIQLRFYPPVAASTYMYVDGIMVSNGSALSNYADGSTAGWAWSGTTNGSTSSGMPQ